MLDLLYKERTSIIVNLAAQGEGAASWNHSWRCLETNAVDLAKFVEELTKRDYLERVFHTGISELYGSINNATKEGGLLKPKGLYAASKAAFDLYLLAIQKVNPFHMSIIRTPNADRPGQDARYWLDWSAIARYFAWKAQIILEEGLPEMLTLARKCLDELKTLSTVFVMPR